MEMEMISQAPAAEAFAAYFASSLQEKDVGGSGSSGRSAFQWGASFSALFLLILNQLGRKSTMQASLLILYLITSFPTALFKILRGQFGCWVAFLAVIGNLTFPHIIPVSRVPLFVIIPDWLASELRDSIVGGVFCLIITILLVITEVRDMGGCWNCQCSLHCFGYWLSMILLLFFTILYLCLGPW